MGVNTLYSPWEKLKHYVEVYWQKFLGHTLNLLIRTVIALGKFLIITIKEAFGR